MNQPIEPTIPKTYLALGDSYTIGEGVPIHDSYPYQAIQILREKGFSINAPEIIAKTGWTTDELSTGMNGTQFMSKYDYVSLLIGVNNQYRGKKTSEYELEFEALLKRAIALSGNNSNHVFVISIPDWGATPFAEGRDTKKIGEEIDAFNNINKTISEKYSVSYIEITEGSRDVKNNQALVARDKLHPSGLEYGKWARKLAEKIYQAN
jgi:lysophospholipase L1-like esterase